MKIDYSLPSYSTYYLCADANVRLGSRHIQLALSPLPINGLYDILERIYHLVLGCLECLPGAGHALSIVDYYLNKDVTIIYLNEANPYERGCTLGRTLKNEIQTIYSLVGRRIAEMRSQSWNQNGLSFDDMVHGLQQHLPDHVMHEMEGIATGAGVELHEVFQVHAFLDIFAGQYGCSAVASSTNDTSLQRITTTNHFKNDHSAGDSMVRKILLDRFALSESVSSHQNALYQVDRPDTIQSIVFDLNEREVHLSTAWNDAAGAMYRRFSFFQNTQTQQTTPQAPRVKLARNLDWPWFFLAPYTILVVTDPGAGRRKFVNVTFPGFVGTFSGMNEDGVAVACCQAGRTKQADGIPVTLLFRDVLERARSTDQAEDILSQAQPGSSMNLTVAGLDGAMGIELDPARQPLGYALRRNFGE